MKNSDEADARQGAVSTAVAEANLRALTDLIGEIRHEYPNASVLTLRESCGHLTLERLQEDTGYTYGLDDSDSLFETAWSIDTADTSWPNGVAESVPLDSGKPGWTINLAAAAQALR